MAKVKRGQPNIGKGTGKKQPFWWATWQYVHKAILLLEICPKEII